MIRSVLIVLLMAFGSHSFAQCFSKAKEFTMRRYDKDAPQVGFKKWHIKSKYGRSKLINTEPPEDFYHGRIVAIDYYYTAFGADTVESQLKLDSLRWHNLEWQCPMVFRMVDKVPVRFIEQTNADTRYDALFYYHGFVVHYEVADQSKEARAEEIRFLDRMYKRNWNVDESPDWGMVRQISGTRPGDILQVWGYKVNISKPDTMIRSHALEVPETAEKNSSHHFVTAFLIGEQVADDTLRVDLFRIPKNHYPGSTPPPFTNGAYRISEKPFEETKIQEMAFRKPKFQNEIDGDLFSALRRFEKKDIVLVVDVTSSMTKSVGQTLKYAHYKKTRDRIKGYVFFNDGDSIANGEKNIGSTGGIYACEKIESTEENLITAMKSGTGGDYEENDIEALIKAQETFGPGNYVLVADNLSNPRDIGLISKLKYPVNILLCNGIEANEMYMDIAEATGGVILNKK